MKVRVGLMGFGRVGRNIFRILSQRPGDDFEVVAISDPADPKSLEYLLKYDTQLGRFPGQVTYADGHLRTNNKSTRLIQGRDPADSPWGNMGVDVVIEATNRTRSRQEVNRHLELGAKRVVLCVPTAEPPDVTVVMGVNQQEITGKHRVISNASMTAHAAVPIIKILDQAFGVERLFFTTVHAYTTDQRLADVPADDLRRSRAAAENIVPTETKTDKLIGMLIPALKDKVTGMALKVPIPNGSMLDMVSFTKKPVTAAAVNDAVRQAAADHYAKIVEYSTDPIVSSDVKQSPYSGTYDSLATMVLGEHAVKTITWYDNGWGYAHRAIELVEHLAKMQGGLS